MCVSDVWANKQIKSFIDQSHFTKDKLLICKFNKILTKKIEAIQR
jgi:hypothetical protein